MDAWLGRHRRAIIDRKIRPLVEAALEDTRAVLGIGPRQAGKTTLARQFSGADLPDNHSPERQ
jgi:predicted AAA+ superfamily ATPase